MNILFTNQTLRRRGGGQLMIRDLACGFRKRGHAVLAYCSLVPPPDDSLAEEAVPITASLSSLPFVPDVIHAQHQLDAMAAVMALPGVPAVYCCNGATHMEKQPLHPRILRYVAMSPTLRLRMAVESGIDEGAIDVVYNAVDLERFAAVREPPARPLRALVYKRNVDPDTHIGREIRTAAARAGLEVEFRGIGPGLAPIAKPEEALPRYDLVFTSGKSAIEALACGCAVIAIANTSSGELIATTNFERFRRANFAPPVNSPPPDAGRVLAEIERYDAAEVAATALRLRQVAGLDAALDAFMAIYRHAIAAWQAGGRDARAEQLAAARYLRTIAPLVGPVDELGCGPVDLPDADALRRRLVRQVRGLSA